MFQNGNCSATSIDQNCYTLDNYGSTISIKIPYPSHGLVTESPFYFNPNLIFNSMGREFSTKTGKFMIMGKWYITTDFANTQRIADGIFQTRINNIDYKNGGGYEPLIYVSKKINIVTPRTVEGKFYGTSNIKILLSYDKDNMLCAEVFGVNHYSYMADYDSPDSWASEPDRGSFFYITIMCMEEADQDVLINSDFIRQQVPKIINDAQFI